jgi:hypothetical protein
VNVLQAIRDQAVFGPAFRNRASWLAWEAFLAALFGLPMNAEQLRIYRACTGRSEAPTEASNEAWLVCGRRAGKSFVLALVAVFIAAYRDWRPFLTVGEFGTVMIIASDRRQARTIMRYAKALLTMVPMLKRTIVAETAETITLSNRIVIEVHSCSFRAVRGYTVIALLADEIAFWRTDEDAANVDDEVLAAVRPAMATVPGAMFLCASSPYARRGALWDAFKAHWGNDGGPLIWKAPTRVMNPCVPERFIQAELEKDPIGAAAEYLAEFRSDIEGYVAREVLDQATDYSVHERPLREGIRYSAFVDPSGGSVDAFTLAIAHKEGECAILDCVREVRPPLSPEGVIDEFADVLRTYRVRKVTGDRYGGLFPVEAFRKKGITYRASERSKTDIYRDALPLLNSGRARLLGNVRMINQFLGLERRTARGGRDSIDHAPGGHDDLANAVAGALLLATAKKPVGKVSAYHCGYGPPPKSGSSEPLRVRFVTVKEEDMEAHGLRTLP